MSQNKKISHIYNPDNQTRQELLDNFVVRLPVFEKLFRAVKNSRMDTVEQHFLIQGQRGSGKTTLLLKLAYEIEKDTALSEWLIPVRLNEEQYNIFSLCRLWESVADQLGDFPGFEDLPNIMEKSFDDEDYPDTCFRILEKRLQREKRKVILLIDNMVDLLQKMSEKESRKLRDILHTTTEIRIIAASAKTLEQSFKYDKPFYEFFKIIYLGGLDRKETETLLLNLAKQYQKPAVREIIEKYPARVETLRRLTGGIPRTMILLFEIFVDDSANIFEDLEMILDRITPLYKHRMDDLSSQQQAIMDAIALNWDAVSTGDIAAKVRMESKAVAAQLKLLENANLIQAIPADRKNKLYLITERFFNIWYLMRYGRKRSREQVRFLVRFLEEWCGPEELTDKIRNHISLAKANDLHAKGAYYMCEALAQCAPNSKLQDELVQSTREYLSRSSPDLADNLSPSDGELVAQAFSLAKKDMDGALRKLREIQRPDADILNILGVFYWKVANDLEKAEENFSKAIEKGDEHALINFADFCWEERKEFKAAEKYYLMAVEKGDADAMNSLAGLYFKKNGDMDATEKFCLMAVERGNADAMTNLANLYKNERKDFDAAEKYYLMAVEKGHIGAMNNLADFYWEERKDFNAAEKYYLMAVEKGDPDAMNILAGLYFEKHRDLDATEKYCLMAVEKGHAGAMFNLANLYLKERKDIDAAEKYYFMALEKGHVDAMHNLATLYWKERKNPDTAEKYYLMAVKKGHAEAMNNLAALYKSEHKNIEAAEKYYLMAVGKGHAGAMVNLALLYCDEHKDLDAAEKYYLMAIKKGHSGAMVNLANFYWEERQDPDAAEKYYLMAVENGHADAMFNLALFYKNERKNLDASEKYYLMAVEKGQAEAMTDLASFYWKERKDIDAAEKYYLMAVEKEQTKAMIILANLYLEERKDLDAAEKYYLMAVGKENADAMNGLAWLFFQTKRKKEEALKLAARSVELSKYAENTHTLAVCLLWNDRYDESVKMFRTCLDFDPFDRFASDITLYLVFLLAKKQNHLLLELFKDETYRLKERFKPVYYALMYRMREEYPKEYKKMGEELRQTVEEILAEADKMAFEYA